MYALECIRVKILYSSCANRCSALGCVSETSGGADRSTVGPARTARTAAGPKQTNAVSGAGRRGRVTRLARIGKYEPWSYCAETEPVGVSTAVRTGRAEHVSRRWRLSCVVPHEPCSFLTIRPRRSAARREPDAAVPRCDSATAGDRPTPGLAPDDHPGRAHGFPRGQPRARSTDSHFSRSMGGIRHQSARMSTQRVWSFDAVSRRRVRSASLATSSSE